LNMISKTVKEAKKFELGACVEEDIGGKLEAAKEKLEVVRGIEWECGSVR